MKINKIAVLALVITSLCCYRCERDDEVSGPVFSLEQADYFTPEEYQIYSLVINEFTSEQVVIRQTTSTSVELSWDNYFCSILIENKPDIDTTLVINYHQQNDSSYNLSNIFTCPGKEVILISTDEIQYIFSERDVNDGWERFYNEYENSNGILGFTRIGFNENHDQAILETGLQYGSLGGHGRIIYLEKISNGWVIKERIPTWIS